CEALDCHSFGLGLQTQKLITGGLVAREHDYRNMKMPGNRGNLPDLPDRFAVDENVLHGKALRMGKHATACAGHRVLADKQDSVITTVFEIGIGGRRSSLKEPGTR